MISDYARKYDFLREPARRVTEAYEYGTRAFDQMKEHLLIKHGLAHTAEMFHRTAHWFPGEFDTVGDILHQFHVVQDYGATPAFEGAGEDVGAYFQTAAGIFDRIEGELVRLILEADSGDCPAAARQFESLQVSLSEQRAQYMRAWKMFEEATSASSFDSWVAHLTEGGG